MNKENDADGLMPVKKEDDVHVALFKDNNVKFLVLQRSGTNTRLLSFADFICLCFLSFSYLFRRNSIIALKHMSKIVVIRESSFACY